MKYSTINYTILTNYYKFNVICVMYINILYGTFVKLTKFIIWNDMVASNNSHISTFSDTNWRILLFEATIVYVVNVLSDDTKYWPI